MAFSCNLRILSLCKVNRYDNRLAKRVITIAPLPPEKSAYALARYSRSADSIRQSIDWVRTHNSQQFLESFYFQYGHQSIADLGHTVLCFEGISELAASEIEDEVLWDGQAKSSRYQDFSTSGFIVPPEFDAPQQQTYQGKGERLLARARQAPVQGGAQGAESAGCRICRRNGYKYGPIHYARV